MIDLLLEDPNIQTVLAGSAGAKDDVTLEGYIAEVFRMFRLLSDASLFLFPAQGSILLSKAPTVRFLVQGFIL